MITCDFSSLLYFTVYPSGFYYIGLTCFTESIPTFKVFHYIAFIKCQYVHICLHLLSVSMCTYACIIYCQYVHICLCTHVQTLAHLWQSVGFSLSTMWVLRIKFRLSGLKRAPLPTEPSLAFTFVLCYCKWHVLLLVKPVPLIGCC